MCRPGTAIGNVDSPLQADVDAGGLLTLPSGWSLGWWVRASDRWHVPAEERGTAIAQRLLDGAPVVETGLRVPGGQVVHRAWCTVTGDDEWAVVEVENRSREPVGVALTIAGAHRIGYRDRVVIVDGAPAVVLPRDPSRHLVPAAPHDGGDDRWPGDVRARTGRERLDGTAAFVFPLAHTAQLRVAVPLAPSPSSRASRARSFPLVDVAALADAERVANGWRAHAQPPGSMRVELPDSAMADAVLADRAALLVVHDDPRAPLRATAAALASLGRWGHHDTVRRALRWLPDDLREHRWDGAGQVLAAIAEHHRHTGDRLAEALVGPVAEAAHRLRRAAGDPWSGVGQLAAAELLDGAGQPEAAERCRALAGASAPGAVADDDHGVAAAASLDEVGGLLLGEDERGLALAPRWPDGWLGQSVEVHDAPTRWGRLSYAVRWHGSRPALLWELEPRGHAVRLTTPGLDPSWSTTEASGEALLSPVEPAGGLPGVVAPLAGHGTPASAADEGGSFV